MRIITERESVERADGAQGWKVGDRLASLPPGVAAGEPFMEEDLEGFPQGTVTQILVDYPKSGSIRLEVEWDDDYKDSREDPRFVAPVA